LVLAFSVPLCLCGEKCRLDQVGFEHYLEDLLGRSVDVVVEGGIIPYLEASILRDAFPL